MRPTHSTVGSQAHSQVPDADERDQKPPVSDFLRAEDSGQNAQRTVLIGVVTLFVAALAGIIATGGVSIDRLREFADWVESLGPSGRFAYGAIYFGLELVAVPATPLTIAAGYLFGVLEGSVVVSTAATLAAASAFMIARYGLREFVLERAVGFPAFRAVDRAIAREGFKNVLLLRLSPLLPFSISNYLYGLTSVAFWPYTLASWIGMLPGTIAYVYGGAALQELTDIDSLTGSGSANPLLLGVGFAATILVLGRLGGMASQAVEESTQDESVPPANQ